MGAGGSEISQVRLEKGKSPRVPFEPTTAKGILLLADAGIAGSMSLIGKTFTQCLDLEPILRDFCSPPEVFGFLKNFCSFWLPYALGDTLPPKMPLAPWKYLSKHYRSYLKLIFAKGGRCGRRHLVVAGAIAYSKRSFPSLTPDIRAEKIRDFRIAMSRSDPKWFPFRSRIEKSIDSIVDSLPIPVADYDRPFVPSTASCVERSRANGGAQSYIRELLQSYKTYREVLEKGTDDRAFLFVRLEVFSKIDLLEKYLQGLFTFSGTTMETSLERLEGYTTSVWGALRDVLIELSAMDQNWTMRQPVEPVGLLEPLKLRIITKQTWSMALLKPVQKAFHTALRRDPRFQLIGGADELEVLTQLLPLSPGHTFISGDYEAATDNIYLWATRCALNAMWRRMEIRGLRPDQELYLRRLANSLFTNSYIKIREEVCEDITRGQLMGNILSFPLLCLINAAVTELALGHANYRINGDDVAFHASAQDYNRWKYITSCAGLKFSLGKNYSSNSFWMINSKFFKYYGATDLRQITFPNVGLLRSSSLLEIDDHGVEVSPVKIISSLLEKFLIDIRPQFHNRAIRLFKKSYKNFFQHYPGSIYGPIAVGNLGLPIPEDWVFTRYQRIWMTSHLTGAYSHLEGRRTELSRLCDVYSKILGKNFPTLEFAVPVETPVNDTVYYGTLWKPGMTIGDGPRIKFPDPFSRGGGFELSHMAILRWFVPPSSVKAVSAFGFRRFNRWVRRHDKSLEIKPPDWNWEANIGYPKAWVLAGGQDRLWCRGISLALDEFLVGPVRSAPRMRKKGFFQEDEDEDW